LRTTKEYRIEFQRITDQCYTDEYARLEVLALALQDAQLGEFPKLATLAVEMQSWTSVRRPPEVVTRG
jgi:hypothetical protein